MRNTLIVAVLVVGVGAFGAWMYAQPGKAFKAVQVAMDRDDPALLAPWLDLQALRSNIKNRQAAILPPDLPKEGPAGLLGLFGQALVEGLMGSLVQGVATPEGVLAILRGAAAGAPAPEGGSPRTPSERLFGKARAELIGFDTYVVTSPMKGGHSFKLVFKRDGSKWKLSDLGVFAAPPGQPS